MCARVAGSNVPGRLTSFDGFMSTSFDCGIERISFAAHIEARLVAVKLLELVVRRVVTHGLIAEREDRQVIFRILDRHGGRYRELRRPPGSTRPPAQVTAVG